MGRIFFLLVPSGSKVGLLRVMLLFYPCFRGFCFPQPWNFPQDKNAGADFVEISGGIINR
jgi:hypothetical protein